MKAQGSYTMSFTNDYEIIDHTADIGIRVKGNSLNSVIKKAVLALSDLMSGQMKIDRDEEKEFKIHEDEPDIAMVGILEEVLYLFEHQKFAVSDCRVSIDNNDYIIELKGRLYNLDELKGATEIKAVTYHMLSVKKVNDNWEATVIFDI